MKRVQSFLNSIWFPALSPSRLAVIRILTGLFALWYLAGRYNMILKVASADTSLFQPIGVVSFLASPWPLPWVEALLIFTLVMNVAFVLGWQYRISGPAFALSLLVLLCYRNSWSMIYHNDNAMVLHVLVLGFTRAADVLSLDSLFRRASHNPSYPTEHWRYGWPVQLLSAVTLGGYFLSGVAKLASDSGLSWLFGESLRSQIAVDAIRKELLGAATSPLAYQLYDQVWLFTIIGTVSLLVELGAPLALLHPRLGYAWVANAFLMHWGIFLLMHITFRYQMAGFIFLSFLPLERLVDKLRQRKLPLPEAGEQKLTLLFDGHCRFCIGQMRLLKMVDVFGQLRFLSLHDEQARELAPSFSHDELMQQMVAVSPSGQAAGGAAAVRTLSRHLPMLWILAPLLHFPGSLPLWAWAYRQVAESRYRIAGMVCEDGTCSFKPANRQGVSNAQ
ncbi:MAG: DCC1-like thiol-disulfide oxidoreductase family protein [Bryobacter sp.]|nr:DCC1-like thiol-disulfide oxidoreductase family protein [Bryobacter sp.]